MTTFIERLTEFGQTIKLEDRFNFDFEIDSNIFTDNEKNSLLEEQNIFRRNVRLKELIKNKANNSYELTNLNFWIINNWGGIRTFKENEKNLNRFKEFSAQLLKSKLTLDTFGTISSLSKVASFIDPDNYVIYDSRVVYAINWLILTTGTTELKYFPMPSSRNKKLVDFDINTIINLVNIEKYKRNETLYYDHKTAYFEFCDLIKSLVGTVFNDNQTKPYHLEMLLFTIADKEIFDELTKKISIGIKPTANMGLWQVGRTELIEH